MLLATYSAYVLQKYLNVLPPSTKGMSEVWTRVAVPDFVTTELNR